MKAVNRLDVYMGIDTELALEIVDSWGNRAAYKNNSKKQHLINNMQGWLAEEIFKTTFPEWEYINPTEHMFITEFSGWYKRTGQPDFISHHDVYGEITCEVKTYATKDICMKKIESWKTNAAELHNANFVYILIGKTWYSLNRITWELVEVCKAEFPIWYKGRFVL